jgi:hypothetical protein
VKLNAVSARDSSIRYDGAMKLLHPARHAFEAHMIRGFLDSHGIEAQVRGEYLTSGWGELPADVCAVWITDDARFDEADALLKAFLNGSYATGLGTWRCESCGETLEGQFTTCWNCGTPRGP